MQSVSDALATLHRDISWFARAREHRCLVATVGGDLRAAAMKVIAAGEVHADNRAAWVTLEDAMLAAEPGWAARSNRLVEHWTLRREAFAKEHVELPEVTAAEGDTPAAFAAALGAVLDALRAPLEGRVVVLAPTVVDGSLAVEPVLHALFEHPTLGRARWVLAVDESVAPFAALVGAPSLRCLTSRAVVDAATLDRDLDAIVSPAGGVAMPRGVTPPGRVDDPPPLPREKRDEALRAAGVDPATLDALPELRTRVLGAAVAMKRGRGAEAIALQREARDLAASSGMHLAAALCSITLARYATGLGAYGELRVPATLGTVRTSERARDFRVALSSNWERGAFAVMGGAYLRYFRDADPGVSSRSALWEGAAVVRPMAWFGQHAGVALEASYQRVIYDALDPETGAGAVQGSSFRGALVPFVSPTGRGSYARPQLQLVYQVTVRDAGALRLRHELRVLLAAARAAQARRHDSEGGVVPRARTEHPLRVGDGAGGAIGP